VQTPLVIGWKERVDFPDWGVTRVRVKMDSGARTSAIDAIVREVRDNPDGSRTAVLLVAFYRRKPDKFRVVEAPLVRTSRVRNTGGELCERHVVATRVRIGPVTKTIHLAVADRGRMLSPVLLGRKALAGDFLIDVGRKYALQDK
jgi:hypothetical protein